MATEEERIPKLESLSMEAAVEGFKRNAYSESSIEIIPEFKHNLFDKLYIPHVALTPEVIEGMLKMRLTTKSLVLGRDNLDEHHRKLFYSISGLEKFTMLDWNVEEKYGNKVPEKCKRTIDIIAFLKDCLCPESRITLRKLCIRGRRNEIIFPLTWVSELIDLLPGITILEVNGCTITDDNFCEICERYPDLTELDIDTPGVRYLDRIEQLNKLKILTLRNSPHENKKYFEALPLPQNLELSVSDRISISNLKTLDMFLCQLEYERAQKLFDSNPNMEEILNMTCVSYPNVPCTFL